jgi:hypothetical protein
LYLLFNRGPTNLFFDSSVIYPGKITFQIHKSNVILIHSLDEIFSESKFDVQGAKYNFFQVWLIEYLRHFSVPKEMIGTYRKQSGTPLGVQCSSSRTYSLVHISKRQYMPWLVHFDLWKMCDKRLINFHLFPNSYWLFQMSNLHLRPLNRVLSRSVEPKKGPTPHWVKFRPSHDTKKSYKFCIYSSSRV